MKKIVLLASALIASTALTGCVVGEPAPYYSGGAPYYGTTYAPAYAYGEVGYYPYQRSQHVYSNYNNNYWHHQRSGGTPQAQAHSQPHAQAARSGGQRSAPAAAHSGGGRGGNEGDHR